jgi:hypothetical protein
MSLPTPVQRQLDAAAAAQQALNTPATEPAPPAVEVPKEPEPAPPAPALQAPAPAPTPAAPVDTENALRTLRGRMEAEQRRANEAIRLAQEQNAQLQQRLAHLEQAAAQKPNEPAKDTQDHKDFGEDLVEMVRRQSALQLQQFQSVATKLEGRIAALEQSINGVSQRTTMTLEQQFYATLDGLVPDWRAINDDERWLAWLAEVDPIFGAQRQAALTDAHNAFDAKRVANVFAKFKAELPKPTPAPSLASQVAPSSAPAAAPTPAPAKPFVSEKEIVAFYRDIAQGKYRGRQADQARKEQEFNLAIAEGRVR